MVVLGSCAAAPYEPAGLFLPAQDGEAALRSCVAAVRPYFPRLRRQGGAVLWSDWVTAEGGGTAFRRRLEIAAEPAAGGTLLLIAVHRIKIGAAALGDPCWVDDGGDREAEERVLEALERDLGGRRLRFREAPGRPLASPTSG